MKKVIAIILFVVALCVFVVIGSAQSSFAYGDFKLLGGEAEVGLTEIIVRHVGKHRAKLIAPGASIEAELIKGNLKTGKDGELALVKGVASGGVVIHAKQVDSSTKTYRIIDAVAQEATMIQGENTIVLTGNVSAKVTDPQFSQPATLSGDRVTIFLKENKVLVRGSDDKPAEITASPREGKSK